MKRRRLMRRRSDKGEKADIDEGDRRTEAQREVRGKVVFAAMFRRWVMGAWDGTLT